MKTDPNNSWQILEMMDVPIFLHDSQFRLIFANLAYYRDAGVTKNEALGRPYWEVFPRGTSPLPNCKKKTQKYIKEPCLDEFTVGNKIYSSQGFQTTIDLNGTKGFLHVLTDISKKVVLENAFKKMASQFRVLFETSPDAIIAT